jgi:hypothetical protein
VVHAGIDQALWDIKGKDLGVPVYELLGGRVRDKVRVYTHFSGPSASGPLSAASFDASVASACSKVERGFALQTSVTSWRGNGAVVIGTADVATSDQIVKTGSSITAFDDFGRVTDSEPFIASSVTSRITGPEVVPLLTSVPFFCRQSSEPMKVSLPTESYTTGTFLPPVISLTRSGKFSLV